MASLIDDLFKTKISRRSLVLGSGVLVASAALDKSGLAKLSNIILPTPAYAYADEYIQLTDPEVCLYDAQGNFSGQFTITNIHSEDNTIKSIELLNREQNTTISFDQSTPFTLTSGQSKTINFTGKTVNSSGLQFKASDIRVNYSAVIPILYTTKYAVRIYGIKHDVDRNGNKLGLTFGPATSSDYRNTFVSHTPTGSTDSGNQHRCLHEDSWEDVVYWSKTDPYVYEQCLENGCTHGVELSLNEVIVEKKYEFSGDGAGILLDSIKSSYKVWNGTSADYNNDGGWRASFLRRTLNGSDFCIQQDGEDTISSCAQGAEVLNSDNCLLSCFPTVLRENIVAAAKQTDTVYNDKENSNKVTYDKLWMLSTVEIYENGGSNNYCLRPKEGLQYEHLNLKGVRTNNYGYIASYNEDGKTSYWWTRSSGTFNRGNAYYVVYRGDYNDRSVCYIYNGLAPCFSLS